VHRVGAEKAVEIARRHTLDLCRNRADGFDQAALGVFRQQEAIDAPRRVLESRLDGMEAEQPNRPIRVAPSARICNVSSRRLCPARCTRAATGKAGEALFLAPRLFEMFVWQDVSRDWLGRPRPIDARLQADAARLGGARGRATVRPCRFSD